MKAIFFYGLFMDIDLLKGKGFTPTAEKLAYAEGYGLRIGERATLVKAEFERAYGIVMNLSEEEAETLYSGPGVSEYVPEEIYVTEAIGVRYKATVYNLPTSKLTGSNEEYAKSLCVAAKKMGLPETYINEILSWAE